MPSERRSKIFTRQSDVANLPQFAEARLGGVVLYGESEELLSATINELEGKVEEIVRSIPSADRHSITALVLKDASGDVNRRVVSAVIGSVLRKGRLVLIPGEDEGGAMVAIVCSPGRRSEFGQRLDALEDKVRVEGQMLIRGLRDVFFPQAESGAWTWTWHLAARAAYLGRVCFVDRYRICWPGDFGDVLGTPG